MPETCCPQGAAGRLPYCLLRLSRATNALFVAQSTLDSRCVCKTGMVAFGKARPTFGWFASHQAEREMWKRSAGILMYRTGKAGLEVLLVHQGGPFWAKKDVGSWSIPKGEHSASEDPLAVAVREFEEETGLRPSGTFQTLGEITQPSRKIVTAWAVEGD